MRLKKHVHTGVALFALAVAAGSLHAETLNERWPTYGEPEDLGAPLTSTQLIHGVTTRHNGQAVAATTLSGDPAKFNVFDLENGEVLQSYDIPKGKTFWAHGVDSRGNVYFAGYLQTTLYRYSPHTNEVIEIGRLFGEQAACAITFDDADNVYIGTYPNAKVIKYDPIEDKLIDLGRMLQGENYMKSLAYHDGYLYGGGMKPNPEFVRIAVDSMQVQVLPQAGSGKVSSYYYASEAGGLIFMNAATSGGKHSLFVYDPIAAQWLDFEVENYRGLVVSPEIDGLVYFSADGNLWEFDLQTREARRTDMQYNTGLRGGGIVRLNSDERFSDPSFVNFFYGGDIAVYNFKTGAAKMFRSKLDPGQSVISEIAMSGNAILIGEFMGTRMKIVDTTDSQKSILIPLGQAESAKAHDGKIYFGIYPTAAVDVYDPAMPPQKDKNPRRLFDLKEQGQSRPFAITFANGKLITGMTADYGLTEGALAVYDLDSEQLEIYKNLLPDQNFTSLTEKDGTVWGSTSIWGGLGGEPRAKAAMLFSFDPQTGKIIHAAAPSIDGINAPIKAWGAVRIGPDNLLWAVSYGMVAAFDPHTLQPVKQLQVVPTNWENVNWSWGRHSLDFTSDGLIVTNPGSTLVLIDPADMSWKRLLPDSENGKISQNLIAPNGDIYYRSDSNSSRLFRLPAAKQSAKD